MLCQVANCKYLSESALDDFLVCALHDSTKVRAILERGERPGHFWAADKPIILPCGELTLKAFEEKPARKESIKAGDDAVFQTISSEVSSSVLAEFDLSR